MATLVTGAIVVGASVVFGGIIAKTCGRRNVDDDLEDRRIKEIIAEDHRKRMETLMYKHEEKMMRLNAEEEEITYQLEQKRTKIDMLLEQKKFI